MKKILFRFMIWLWDITPMKFVLKHIIKVSPYVKGKLHQDLRFKGVMRLIISGKSFKLYNPGYTTIENEIFWNGVEGGWEKKSIQVWQRLCNCSNTILDIGANTGIYSFIANAVNPDAKIYAFEPVRRTAEIFKKNIALNKPNQIKLFEVAVSNMTGISEFYDVDSASQYSATLNKDMLKNVENKVTYEVDLVKLDSFEEILTNPVDLIKIDVEMHEPEAIEGMIGIIQRDKPSILIEVLNDEIAKNYNIIFKT